MCSKTPASDAPISSLSAIGSASPSQPQCAPNNARVRRQVSRACTHCRRGHTACDEQRPCSRCVARGRADSCVDHVRVPRRRPQSPLNSTPTPTGSGALLEDAPLNAPSPIMPVEDAVPMQRPPPSMVPAFLPPAKMMRTDGHDLLLEGVELTALPFGEVCNMMHSFGAPVSGSTQLFPDSIFVDAQAFLDPSWMEVDGVDSFAVLREPYANDLIDWVR